LIAPLAVAGAGLLTAQPVAASPYSIDGLTLGERLQLGRDYQCAASEQVDGFRWCQRQRQERGKLGSFSSTVSILQNSDGTAVYLNRLITPAFFGPYDIPAEIAKLSSGLFSERARDIRLSPREDLPSAVIAMWGKIQLEPLDGEALAKLASERPSGQSLLVDYLGDLKRSAQLGLPVLRLTGGAGYLWSASVYPNGRGHLRFLAVDASALVQKVTPLPPKITLVAPKLVSAHPAVALAIAPELQSVRNPAEAILPNTTVRAKSNPDQTGSIGEGKEPASMAAQHPAAWQSMDQTASVRFEPKSSAGSQGHRIQVMIAVTGLITAFLFFLALLIEWLKREPTGLELLELEQRLDSASVTAGRPHARVVAHKVASQIARTIASVGVLAGGAVERLHHAAIKQRGSLALIVGSAKTVVLRQSAETRRT